MIGAVICNGSNTMVFDLPTESLKSGEITAKTAMELTHLKRTSFYKLVRQTEEIGG